MGYKNMNMTRRNRGSNGKVTHACLLKRAYGRRNRESVVRSDRRQGEIQSFNEHRS